MPEVVAATAALRPLMLAAMEKDAADFANQHPGFVADPVAELAGAMSYAATDASIRNMFDEFVSVMVYASPTPGFEQVLDCFQGILDRLLPEPGTSFAARQHAARTTSN